MACRCSIFCLTRDKFRKPYQTVEPILRYEHYTAWCSSSYCRCSVLANCYLQTVSFSFLFLPLSYCVHQPLSCLLSRIQVVKILRPVAYRQILLISISYGIEAASLVCCSLCSKWKTPLLLELDIKTVSCHEWLRQGQKGWRGGGWKGVDLSVRHDGPYRGYLKNRVYTPSLSFSLLSLW